MPPLRPGFYVMTAMSARDTEARDRQGPFLTLYELCEWLYTSGIEYRAWGQAWGRAPAYFGEMTGDSAGGMWAAGVELVMG